MEIVQLPFKWYITLNGQAINTDVVDRPNTDVVPPFKLGGQNVICHLLPLPGDTSEQKHTCD